MPYVDTTVDAARLEARATRKRRGAWVILGGVLEACSIRCSRLRRRLLSLTWDSEKTKPCSEGSKVTPLSVVHFHDVEEVVQLGCSRV